MDSQADRLSSLDPTERILWNTNFIVCVWLLAPLVTTKRIAYMATCVVDWYPGFSRHLYSEEFQENKSRNGIELIEDERPSLICDTTSIGNQKPMTELRRLCPAQAKCYTSVSTVIEWENRRSANVDDCRQWWPRTHSHRFLWIMEFAFRRRTRFAIHNSLSSIIFADGSLNALWWMLASVQMQRMCRLVVVNIPQNRVTPLAAQRTKSVEQIAVRPIHCHSAERCEAYTH